MPYVALSLVSQSLQIESCRFLLVSETSSDHCRPLHIPLSDVCRSGCTSAATVPRINDRHKLVVGKCRPELYWALEKVPNNLCSWKHAALWLDRLDLDGEVSTAIRDCAVHPALPNCILRVQCLGATPLLITRFADHSSVLVEPGQPQFLRAYDSVTLGNYASPEHSVVLRFLPLAQRNDPVAAVAAPEATERSGTSSHLGTSSIASSLLSFGCGANSASGCRPRFFLPDDSVRREGCITSTQLLSLIISDVVANLTMLGGGLPIAMKYQRASLQTSDPVMIPVLDAVEETPPDRPPSHISESEPEGSRIHTQKQQQEEVPCEVEERRSPLHGSKRKCPTGVVGLVRSDNSVVDADVTSVCHHPEISVAERKLGAPSKRARSDSTASVFSPSQREIVPCPTARLRQEVVNSDEDPFLLVPASVSSLGGVAPPSRGRRAKRASSAPHESSSISSSSPSVYTGGSLPESFDDKWDAQLLALEARSTARAANVISPQKLLGASAVLMQQHRASGGATASAVTLFRADSDQHILGGAHPSHNARQEDPQPESQMVYFGHSQ